MQERLREGVEAARRGDKLAARRLLQQVLIADPYNEIALMWMASVVDSLAERRSYLEKALRVNPNNERAREALRRLGGAKAANPAPQPALAAASQSRQAGGVNLLLLLLAVIVITGAIIAVAITLNDQQEAAAQQNAAATFEAALEVAFAVTDTPTPMPGTPTPTEFFGIVVTLDPAQVELPPTFTPTFTPTPTETPLPTATPLPLSEFEVLYSDYEVNAALPALYRALADGSGERLLSEAGYLDVAISPDGQRIAFVRGVGGPAEASAPPTAPETSADPDATLAPIEPLPPPLSPGGFSQLFVAPIENPADAIQLTNLTGAVVSSPSWSPDGRTIVFASSDGSSSDLYLIAADGGAPERLTDDDAFHTSPSFSPRGDLIVFASDLESPGFSEIYTIQVRTRAITRLTDDIGNSYSPAFSPDGTRIAYINDRNGDGDVYVMDANGQRSFLLTTDDGGAEDRTPAWSPDGRWIAFASNRGGANFRWFLINVETRAIVPLADNARSAQSLAFFPR